MPSTLTNIMNYILLTHQQMHFLLNWKSLNLHENTHNYCSYVFRYSTFVRELVQSLAKVTLLLKHSVKLRRCILCGYVAACREMVCAITPFQDMLPHIHTIYNEVILLSVLTEV